MRHFAAAGLVLCFLVTVSNAQTPRFEAEIKAFEASDRTNPPPANAILFIGSSSIRLWKTLSKDFPEYKVINRGFGGSQIADSLRYVDRMVVPYKPRLIVMYAGGNDINDGKTPETVLNDFKAFVAAVHEKLPNTGLAYISIAPNPARWSQVDRVREANRLIESYTRSDKRLSFINAFPQMLSPDGQPRPEIFSDDKLHMNAQGYALWKKIVGEHINTLLKPESDKSH